MSMNEYRNLPQAELEQHLQDVEVELTNLKFQQATHQLQNPLRIREVRRNVARLKTLLHQEAKGIRQVGESSDEQA
jgi:large subunit ribosomal protein L29